MIVSVCICTWNRADLLDQTLSAMRALEIPQGIEWELLVVNNNCTDNTDEILERHASSLPLHRLFEERQGLSHARNRGVDAAKGDLILWTDDDVIVDPDWLTEYVEVSRQWPLASFFGGTVDPWFEVEPPAWIKSNLDSLFGPFAIAQSGSLNRELGPNEFVVGANMAFRRSAYAVEKYNPSLGRVAGTLISGDDFEFVSRIRAGGAFGIWVGTARVRHFIPSERLSKDYIRRWLHGAGITLARVDASHAKTLLFGMPRWAIRSYFESIPGSLVFAISGRKCGFRSFKRMVEMGGLLTESRRLSSPR